MRRVVGLILLAGALIGCNTRTPDRWQLADRYVGWVVVQYENPNCPPLALAGGYNILRIPESGRLCTSSRQPDGEAFDRFEYVKSDGGIEEIDQRSMVWGGKTSSAHRTFVFVGGEQRFRDSADSAEKLDERCTTDLRC